MKRSLSHSNPCIKVVKNNNFPSRKTLRDVIVEVKIEGIVGTIIDNIPKRGRREVANTKEKVPKMADNMENSDPEEPS